MFWTKGPSIKSCREKIAWEIETRRAETEFSIAMLVEKAEEMSLDQLSQAMMGLAHEVGHIRGLEQAFEILDA